MMHTQAIPGPTVSRLCDFYDAPDMPFATLIWQLTNPNGNPQTTHPDKKAGMSDPADHIEITELLNRRGSRLNPRRRQPGGRVPVCQACQELGERPGLPAP
jgi:hypothetical protein